MMRVSHLLRSPLLLLAVALVALAALFAHDASPASAQAGSETRRVHYAQSTYYASETDTHGIRGSAEVCVEVEPPLGSGGSTVHVRIKDDSTATQLDDYSILLRNVSSTTNTKVLHLPHGEARKCFGVTLRRDMLTEGEEVVNLELVAVADAPYMISEHDSANARYPETQIALVDSSTPLPDDVDPGRGINIQPKSATVRSGSKVAYSISLNSRPDDDVTLKAYRDAGSGYDVLSIQQDGKLHVSPSELVFTPMNWATPQFFTVSTEGVDPGRYVILHGVTSYSDDDYSVSYSFRGPGVDGRTHIVIEVTDGSSDESLSGGQTDAAPGTPTSLGAKLGWTTLDLWWAKGPGGMVTGYDVHYTSSSTAGDDDAASESDPLVGWVDANHTGIIPTHPLGGLTIGIAYRVRVRGVDPNGASDWARRTFVTRPIWASTLTVSEVETGVFGCGSSSSPCSGNALPDAGFEVDGTGYQVAKIRSSSSGEAFELTLDVPYNAELKTYNFCVGSQTLPFSDVFATYSNEGKTARWTLSSVAALSWSAGDKVALSIRGACGMTGAGVDQSSPVAETATVPTAVTLSLSSSTASESAGDVTLTATLDAPAPEGGTGGFLLADASSTATEGSDYTMPAYVFIPGGQRAGTATISIIDDDVDEADETAVITTYFDLGTALLEDGVTLTIEDNDTTTSGDQVQQVVGNSQQDQAPANRAPTVSSSLSDVSGLAEGSTRDVSLSGVFSDADGDALSITASSDDETVATVAVASDFSKLTLSGVSSGDATITVVARDPDGARATLSFGVEVTDPEPQQQVITTTTTTPDPEPTATPEPEAETTSTPESEAETEDTDGSDAVARYDADGDGKISQPELRQALDDYYAAKITYSEMLAIYKAYRAS